MIMISIRKISLLFVTALFLFTNNTLAQKKPTIMILPSDNWCTQRYFTTTYINAGTKVRVSDYQRAFQEDLEIKAVIGKIGELLTDMGYSLKDCEQELKNIAVRTAEENVTQSKTSGASLSESPLDMLKKRTKSDIVINADWTIKNEGSNYIVTLILEAFDSYTSKRIATSTGSMNIVNSSITLTLEKLVMENINIFDSQMDKYFNDLKINGREIVLTIRCWDNWENDLETEYDGEELIDCIQNWLNDNTVNKSFNLTDGTENFAQFEQVRVPFYDSKNNPIDARNFANQLRKYLKAAPYEIVSKVIIRGLGEAIVVLGEK
ncbi:MAG: hypothetical protein IKY79_06370 [Bacteroidales bacterium]|nr:hypothetical protein [Bacteroidales bacterium]